MVREEEEEEEELCILNSLQSNKHFYITVFPYFIWLFLRSYFDSPPFSHSSRATGKYLRLRGLLTQVLSLKRLCESYSFYSFSFIKIPGVASSSSSIPLYIQYIRMRNCLSVRFKFQRMSQIQKLAHRLRVLHVSSTLLVGRLKKKRKNIQHPKRINITHGKTAGGFSTGPLRIYIYICTCVCMWCVYLCTHTGVYSPETEN